MWNVAVSDAAIDLGLAFFFGWLALSRERWWPLFMTAAMVLTVLVHVAMFLVPTLGAHADVSARIGLGIVMGLGLLAGVAERWLAGELAVSDQRRWDRRRPPARPVRPEPHSPEGPALSRPIS
jgi:uncharacterized membrane protein